MKTILVGLVLAMSAVAHANVAVTVGNAVGANGGKKQTARMIDASGYPIVFNDDKPWKVFSLEYQTGPAQLLDESGVAPKQGLIKRICMDSAPAIPLAADWAMVWDTSAGNASGIGPGAGVLTAGRRIAPTIQRVSGVEKCVELNVMFTSGLELLQGAATGSTYIYWRELGGSR